LESQKLVNSRTRRTYNLAAQTYHDLFHDELKKKAYDKRLLKSFAGRFGRGSVICDAGCGPSAHIGRFLADRGLTVIGVDISDRCIELARVFNPGMQFLREDLTGLGFEDETFDGVIAYYSIIHTPKRSVSRIFREFHRVLKPEGSLLVAVKAGAEEGYIHELLGIQTEVYFSAFDEKEIRGYFERSGFVLDFLQRRSPYGFEIQNDRLFAIGQKSSPKKRRPS